MFAKRFRLLTLTLLALSIPITAQQSDTQRDDLRINISTDKKCYTRNEEIKVLVKVANTGRTPIYLHHFDKRLYRLDLDSFDQENRFTRSHDPINPPIPKSPKSEDFIKIGAGEAHIQNEQFSLSDETFEKDGEYFLRASYRSRIFEHIVPEFLRGRKVWLFEYGDISSKLIPFTIAGKC